MRKAAKKDGKIAARAGEPSTATGVSGREPRKATTHVSATASSTAATSVKRSKTDITLKVMPGVTESVGSATTMITGIAVVGTTMVTATSAARSICVKPL